MGTDIQVRDRGRPAGGMARQGAGGSAGADTRSVLDPSDGNDGDGKRRAGGRYQPSSVSRSSSTPKWCATSWMTVRRTWSATSASVRQIAQIAWR